jgi:hypothetical protein
MKFSAVSGAGAIGFATVIVLGNVFLVPAGMPLPAAELDEVTAFFAANEGVVGLVSACAPAAWVLATLFGAGAVAVLWPSERTRGDAWSLVGFAGVLMQCVTFTGVVAIRLALAQGGQAESLWALHDAVFTLNGTFLALALVGLSIAGLRAGLLRPWHGRLGLAAAAPLFASACLGPLVIEHGGVLGLIGLTGWLMWVVWLVGYGVTLLRLSGELAGKGTVSSLPAG